MSYTKTIWSNDELPAIDADNLNNIENGIKENEDSINAIALGENLKGEFTPTISQEYPSTPLLGDTWYIQGLTDTGYTFTTGDTIGETANNFDKLIYSSSGWILLEDTDIFRGVLNIDSIADLAGVNTSIYSTVNVRGYYTPNDGGGGLFNYDATQSAVNNGGTIINGWVRQYSGAVNVKLFGAKGDKVADDTIPINNCIEALPNGGSIELPDGDYLITGPIHIKYSAISLRGSGVNSTRIYSSGVSTDGFRVYKDTWADGDYISQVSIKDLSIWKNTASPTGGYGIREIVGSGTYYSNVTVYDFPFGVSKEGCVNTDSNVLKILAGTVNSNTVVGSFGLKITSATLATTAETTGFTHRFVGHFITSNNNSQDYGIVLERADVIKFTGGYLGRQKIAGVIIRPKPSTTGSYVTAVDFNGCYFDGVKTIEQRLGVTIPLTTDLNVKNITFSNAVFGQYKNAIRSQHDNVTNLVIDGQIINNTDEAILLKSTIQAEINVDCFALNSASAPASFDFDTCTNLSLSIVANNITGTLCRISGANDTIDISKIVTDTSYTGTKVSLLGTVAKWINTGTEINFTPQLRIGGVSTGITYSQNIGRFSVNNGIVTYGIYSTLSSRGGLTGNLDFVNPVTPISSMFAQVAGLTLTGTSAGITNNPLVSLITPTSTLLRYGNGTSFTTLTEANISDTSLIVSSGTYI
jgi:hypothetical protein